MQSSPQADRESEQTEQRAADAVAADTIETGCQKL